MRDGSAPLDAARRVRTEYAAAGRTFLRKPAAVFFTFVFPLILVGIVGLVVAAGSVGVFGRSQAYYLPGYLAVVVVLTPLSRISTAVARHRDDRRFEKLATTPLRRAEWFVARTAVNATVVFAASLLILVLVVAVAGATVTPSPTIALLVLVGTAVFCGVGVLLGRLTSSEDGAIAASNAVGVPTVFLAETFVAPDLLPAVLRDAVQVIPLTYFARGVRAASGVTPGSGLVYLVVLTAVALVLGAVAVLVLPWTE